MNTLYFLIYKVKELQAYVHSSKVLAAAAIWTALLQVFMIALGHLMLKRYPAKATVGFFLGFVLIVAQQNLLLSVTIWGSSFGTRSVNRVFSVFAFCLFIVYSVFGGVLGYYKDSVIE